MTQLITTISRNSIRLCADCGCDISYRHGRARYCAPCANERQRKQVRQILRERRETDREYVERNRVDDRERARRKAATERANRVHHCIDCGVSISHRNRQAMRCKPCQSQKDMRKEAERRKNDPELRDRANSKRRRWEKRKRASDPAWVEQERKRVRARQARGRWTKVQVAMQLARQNLRCAKCNCHLLEPEIKYHCDHILPLSLGGDTTPANLQILCPTCNLSKGAKRETLL